MENYELLIDVNSKKENKGKIRMNSKEKTIEFNAKKSEIDGEVIREIIKFVRIIEEKYSRNKFTIHFNFHTLKNMSFVDKLTYSFLEIICVYIIEKLKKNVCVSFTTADKITTSGIYSSPLLLLNSLKGENTQKFLHKFNYDLYKEHFRKVIEYKKTVQNIQYLSILMGDISSFLSSFNISKENRDNVSEVIIELIGNATEHAKSDCLIDLDVSDGYKKENKEGEYYGINIIIINFSNKNLGDSIKTKLFQECDILNEKHLQVKKALKIHTEKFDNEYIEDDFYNLVSFQDKITGRIGDVHTGGTGLTKLIHRLEKNSENSHCYAVTGKRAVWFREAYLEYNEQGWLGFNDERDFLNFPPKRDCIGAAFIEMPGLAYNLNFVMKRDEE